MSLPIRVIDRIFERLSATYGSPFLAMWRDIPIEAVKAAWAHELAGFADRLDSLGWALDHLPERPPNAIEFRNLARTAPPPPEPELQLPAPNPQRVREALEAARQGLIAGDELPGDRLGWAKRILAKAQAGEKVSSASLSMARQAIQKQARTLQ